MLLCFLLILFFFSEGDENGRNVSSDLLGSPPKLSRPSPRKLGFDENSPVATHHLTPPSPSPAAVAQSPKRQGTPAKEPRKMLKKLPVTPPFAESEALDFRLLVFKT